jgi:trehalose 6-phosphate phosphatase
MRPLFSAWKEVAGRLAASRAIALFLDFDGTLAPIRPRPDMVRVHPAARRALAALSLSPRFHVCVISARRRADVLTRLRVPRVRYLGLYGWERTAAHGQPFSPVLHVKNFLAGALPVHPTIWMEDKQYTIAVHYRGAPEAIRRAAADRILRAVSLLPSPALPVYVGDDLSDEAAFAALRHGVSVRVGTNHSSRARYRLDSTTDVRLFLEKLGSEFL